MAKVEEIGWGSYRQYEGPFYRGKHPFVAPEPEKGTLEEVTLAVVTATEGGCYDAWNGYDVCGWTSGLIQWCERGQFSVSDMLGEVARRNGMLITPLLSLAREHRMEFHPNERGRWRFHFVGEPGEVDRLEEQRQLFYKHGDGTKGSWNEETKAYAKRWAAVISSIWENQQAQRIQVGYTVPRLRGFLLPFAKSVFEQHPGTAYSNALYCAYISFAANNPTWANNALQAAIKSTSLEAWSRDWVITVLDSLTFHAKVAIYPHRYNAIRPVLEKYFSVLLPDFATELEDWSIHNGFGKTPPTTKQLQEGLIALGHDLGPAGADGKYGPKTRDAVLTFEQLHGVPYEHQDGMVDAHTWPALAKELEKRGISIEAR